VLLFGEGGEFLGDGGWGKGKGKEGRKMESRKARGRGMRGTGARYRTEACKNQKQDPNTKKATTQTSENGRIINKSGKRDAREEEDNKNEIQ
jgi:hypothetical protein